MTLIDVPEVPPLDRFSLYAYLGLVRVMEPHTELLMRERAQKEIETPDYGPHERPWHVSFHASEFPGEPLDACKRYMLYRMMDLPKSEPMPPWVTTTGTVGKAGELDIADAWFRGGRLLAIPEDPAHRAERLRMIGLMIDAKRYDDARELANQPDIHQLGFVDENVWMTASTDLPILPPGWRRPHIVEVKGKADEVLEEMLHGAVVTDMVGRQIRAWRGPDKAHVNQLKATIGLAHELDWGYVSVCPTCWFITAADIFERLWGSHQHPLSDGFGFCPRCHDYPSATPETYFKLDPPISGEVYYWSRSWPRKTKSFYYEHDQAYLDRGRAVMAEARAHFLADELPPRPEHFQWAVGPCAQCQFKPSACRPDAGVPGRKRKPDPKIIRTTLSTSHGIEHAKTIQTGYDLDEVRARVLGTWSDDG